MAYLQQLSFLVLIVFLGNVKLTYSQFNRAFMTRTSLCQRGTKEGVVRECLQRTGTSYCPSGWKPHRPNNYLMCWARPNVVCCEKEDIPTVNHPECGKLPPIPRIARGEDETKCSSPWQASLRRLTDPGLPLTMENTVHVAGGVLVQSKWVLTTPLSALFAGRSLPNEEYQDSMLVSLGDHRHLDTDGDEQLKRVKQVYFHPNFRFATNTDFVSVIENSFFSGTETVWQENAFALIELESEVNINSCVVPVCLPKGDEERCASSQCKLTGWGANEDEVLKDVLQKADMQILSGDGCSSLEGILNNTAAVPYPARTGCIVNKNGSFACVGDFGGPVVCQGSKQNDRSIVEGLAVTQLDCDDSAIPTRISLVREAMDWIEQTILNNQ